MSRIHDALKKAEQEIAANASSPTPAESPLGVPPSPPREGTEAGVAGEGPRAVQGEGGAGHSDQRLEALGIRPKQVSWSPDARVFLTFNGESRSLGTEEFRTLRSHLSLIRNRKPLQTILVTSPLSQEGKTFVAANLSQAFVWQQEQRVLLIDGDLRLSRLHAYLGAPKAPGLADYLCGDADISAIIQRGPWENFFFIPAGKSVGNAAELIGNGRLKILLERLAPAFDWIVLDSSPAIPVSDARLLAELCDGVLVVVRVGKTPYDLAQRAWQEVRGNQFQGVVLNGVHPESVYSSYYYYRAHQSPNRKSSAEGKRGAS